LNKSLLVKKSNTIEDVIKNVLEKLKMNFDETVDKNKYFLKSVDTEDYLYGDSLFIHIDYINKKLKGKNIF
jgi:hypothetical protein